MTYDLNLYRTSRLLCAAALLLFGSVSCVRHKDPARADRPNLILIATDDQNAQTLTLMPDVQCLLVESGTSFSQAFAPTPLCCPRRASILRGQYAHNHGVRSNDGVNGGFPSFSTRAVSLRHWRPSCKTRATTPHWWANISTPSLKAWYRLRTTRHPENVMCRRAGTSGTA